MLVGLCRGGPGPMYALTPLLLTEMGQTWRAYLSHDVRARNRRRECYARWHPRSADVEKAQVG